MLNQAVKASVDSHVESEAEYLDDPGAKKEGGRAPAKRVRPTAVPDGVSSSRSGKGGSAMGSSRNRSMNFSMKVVPDGEVKSPQLDKLTRCLSKSKLGDRDIERVVQSIEQAAIPTPITEVEKQGDKAARPSRFLVSPNSKTRNKWDMLLIFALMFVASVTPFEVAFVPVDPSVTPLTVLNYMVDATFAIDIVLNFLTPYQTSHGMWVTKHSTIAANYLSSWFLIDVVSVMPFQMLKMVRLVRLAKLLRIFRASRVLKRWETRMSISYGYMTLVKFVMYMMLLSHWLACIFRMVPEYDDPDKNNWMNDYLGDDYRNYTPSELYNLALYWAVMTVTTIGYGDTVPVTDAERWVNVVAMMVGGGAYAYIVGSVCGLVASMGELQARLHRKIDDLNVYMEDQKLPTELRIKLREYFHYTAKQAKNEHYRMLLQEMSPEMRGDVYRRVNEQWVLRIPFAGCSSDFERRAFITSLAEKLEQAIFPPRERFMRPGEISRELYVIERGVVMMNKSYFLPPEHDDEDDKDKEGGTGLPTIDLTNTLGAAEKVILTRGKCLGEDMVLTKSRRRYSCMTLTYLEVHKLTKEALMSVFAGDSFPDSWLGYRRWVIKLAFRKEFVHLARTYQTKRDAIDREGGTVEHVAMRQRTLRGELFKGSGNDKPVGENNSNAHTTAQIDSLRDEIRELKALILASSAAQPKTTESS